MRLVDLIIFYYLIACTRWQLKKCGTRTGLLCGIHKEIVCEANCASWMPGTTAQATTVFLICKHSTVISFFIKQTEGSAMAELDLYSAER